MVSTQRLNRTTWVICLTRTLTRCRPPLQTLINAAPLILTIKPFTRLHIQTKPHTPTRFSGSLIHAAMSGAGRLGRLLVVCQHSQDPTQQLPIGTVNYQIHMLTLCMITHHRFKNNTFPTVSHFVQAFCVASWLC